jgi:hypothetical protein
MPIIIVPAQVMTIRAMGRRDFIENDAQIVNHAVFKFDRRDAAGGAGTKDRNDAVLRGSTSVNRGGVGRKPRSESGVASSAAKDGTPLRCVPDDEHSTL